jgi:hypothetical protein
MHLQTLKCTDQGNGSRNATPNIAPTTRNSSQQDLYNISRNTDQGMHFQRLLQRMHLQTLKCTDQGKRIKECNSKHRPNNSEQFPAGSIQQIKEYRTRHALHFQTRKVWISKHSNAQMKEMDQGMQLQTSPQQLGTVPSRIYATDQGMHFQTRKVCISKHSNAQIKENGSRNATPINAPTTRHSSQRTQDACISKATRMQLQTLKCTDQGKRIKECNSKRRPNNSAQFPTRAGIYATTRHSSHLARTD